MLTALAITEQREERIRQLEEALAQHKLWLSNALDEIACLKAQLERARQS